MKRSILGWKQVVHPAFGFLLFAALWLCGCEDQGPAIPESMSIPPEAAQVVSRVTGGVVSANDCIRVRFTSPVAEERQVSADPALPTKLAKGLFRFEPRIRGISYWEDRQTLVFKPEKSLDVKTSYKGALDLARILPAKDGKSLPPLPLQFTVTGLAVVSFQGDFALVSENNPLLLVYRGKVEFSETVQAEALRNASGVFLNSKKWGLEWTADATGNRFDFKSAVIQRDAKEKVLQFKVTKDKLELGADFTRDAFLPPLTEMEVTECMVRTGGREASIVVSFSDDLDPNRDLTGRVRVSPGLETRVSAFGREIHITGDFEFGKTYTVTVLKGVRSRWGTALKADFEYTLHVKDLKPRIRFSSDGVFVPSANERKLRFETVNVKRVTLNIKKVFESNLGQFLQTERLSGSRDRNENYNHYELERVGVDAANATLVIGDKRNAWLQHEIDLTGLLKNDARGLFLVTLRFERPDMLYGTASQESGTESEGEWDEGGEEAENPGSWWYLNNYGSVYKPLVFSDIGLSVKRAGSRFLVFATDLRDAKPLSGVSVTLRTYQNQSAGRADTDGRGVAEFSTVAGSVFYVEAEKDGQKSAVKLGDMGWNLSGFDTGGEDVSPAGLRAFLYTERGVYRPGDDIHLCCIARNVDGTFPDGHPVTLEVHNPKGQKVAERTSKDGEDGLYHFAFSTHPEDPTGDWLAVVRIAGQSFTRQIKVETVVPYTLKLELRSDKERLGPSDKRCTLSLNAKTLFGSPAGGYQAAVEATLRKQVRSFPAYADFRFDNQAVEVSPSTESLFDGTLDSQGNARLEWVLPAMSNAPSGLEAEVSGRVMEKGGRPNRTGLTIPVDPFVRYVGLKIPGGEAGFVRTGVSLDIPVILVDTEGQPVAGRTLYYRVFRNQQHWWWEFEDQSTFRLRFKNDTETRLAKEGVLTTSENPVALAYAADARGEYFIEVQDGKSGHTAGLFFSAYAWGEMPTGGEGADLLTLKADRKGYHPGDKADIRFLSPQQGSVLVTVEKGADVLSFQWVEPDRSSEWTSVSIPVTQAMLPTAYVTVSVIQPHSQTANDRPLRMYGVLPISVSDPATRQELELLTPEAFEPETACSVGIRTVDGRPTQFTLAVVDEGLLDLTRFATPDPWKAFYRKERLGVQTYDLFSEVVGANKGDVFRTFAVGGGLDEEYRESQLGAEKVKRFKPVVVFRGPLKTDRNGSARVTFDMPNYIGSVRIMVVAVKGRAYGFAEKAVPVKSDLMVSPSLPRVLGAGDRFSLPVTVFAMERKVGSVDVSVEVQGPVSVLGAKRQRLEFTDTGEKDARFDLAAKSAVGPAKITVKASSSRRTATSVTEIAVRASSPRIYETQEVQLKRGDKVALKVPDKGIEGTNQASLTVWRRPPLRLGQRLRWLIHYPYGCIEQTISSVFPQLYLKTILETGTFDPKEIDRNINGGIARLRKFQLANGAFSYWPGGDEVSVWGTDYAGRFLVEAMKLGYSVPEDLFRNWLRFEKNQVQAGREPAFVQIHRLLLLVLAGEPQLGAMNLLKEDSLKVMNDVSRWMLAGAYQVSGASKTAQEILQTAGTRVEEAKRCDYWWITYGTGLRDRAILLEMAVLFQRWPEVNLILDEFTRALASQDWYSTQTLGHMLLALGKAFKTNEGETLPVMAGTIRLPDGTKKKFKTEKTTVEAEITSGFGNPVEVELDESSSVNRVFCELEWNGVPLEPDMTQFSRNLTLSAEWLNENGEPLDTARLKQGTAFWGRFRTAPVAAHYQRIDNVALVQVLPSGWEIENLRLSGEDLPAWAAKGNPNRFDYMDIRDDRIMWFFNFNPYQDRELEFLVKLNAVTAGEFTMPPALCEAMYDANYQARKGGGKVKVEY